MLGMGSRGDGEVKLPKAYFALIWTWVESSNLWNASRGEQGTILIILDLRHCQLASGGEEPGGGVSHRGATDCYR